MPYHLAMPSLHVLRHAKSDRGVATADHERPLAPRGRDAAPRVGRYLNEHFGAPQMALCSTATRAVDTLELVLAELAGTLDVRYEAALYLADAETLRARLSAVDNEVETVLIVGHNPGLASLVQGLGGPSAQARLGKFPTAALATLDVAGWDQLAPEACRLVDYVVPRDLG